jgi:hypothetical protein
MTGMSEHFLTHAFIKRKQLEPTHSEAGSGIKEQPAGRPRKVELKMNSSVKNL